MSKTRSRWLADLVVELKRGNPDLDLKAFRAIAKADSCQSPRPGGGQLLMLAILDDGVRCYLSPTARVAREAELWVVSNNHFSPFSFVEACKTVGLDPETTREALQHLRELERYSEASGQETASESEEAEQ